MRRIRPLLLRHLLPLPLLLTLLQRVSVDLVAHLLHHLAPAVLEVFQVVEAGRHDQVPL